MLTLSIFQKSILALLSFCLVAFGQPLWSASCSFLCAMLGYAFFWRILLCYPEPKKRFWLSTLWFMGVQLVQLSWGISHPFLYIYIVYFLYAFLMGIQFGVLGLFINKIQISKIRSILALTALWTLLEWSRLFFLSGFSWNPVGLALSANLYSLQMASIAGVFGMSFWVMLVNLLALRAWVFKNSYNWLAWSAAALLPYLFGVIHLNYHNKAFLAHQSTHSAPAINTVLVQTAFPAEEFLPLKGPKELLEFVTNEWKQILAITRQHQGKQIDLMVLPEMIVPYGTYTMIYPYDAVKEIFRQTFGEKLLSKLPPLQFPFAQEIQGSKGSFWVVNNLFWLQAIANVFHTDVVAGLGDAEDIEGNRQYYSAAQYVKPLNFLPIGQPPFIERYEKRLLVPMGEYIPFDFLRKLAASYGIQGSFTAGKEAKIFNHQKIPFAISICYEETFGNLIRESRQKGAKLLLNLTSDVWFPNSNLPQQHFDHARLRTVENGIPLIRACNTGVTSGIDSLGRVIALLGEGEKQQEWISDSIRFDVPTYTYSTLYSRSGDTLIIGFCFMLLSLTLVAQIRLE